MSENLPTIYEKLGGETAVRALVNKFYDVMDELPEAYEIRKLHPQDLSGSREKLFKFLSGWFGGPQLYMNEYGHPRLRARHLPFPIDNQARDQWLMCMETAMNALHYDDAIKFQLMQAFTQTANHMRNQ